MTITVNKNPAFWLLAIFLILLGLNFLGMAIPTIVLGILALVAGILMVIATG